MTIPQHHEPVTDLPRGWHRFHNEYAHFITYHGEVYPGYVAHGKNHEGFFILEKANYRTLRLSGELKDVHRLRELGWEITDDRVIAQPIPTDGELGTDVKTSDYHRDTKHTKMFVFGAGASAYCVFDTSHQKNRLKSFLENPLKPPTGFEIFDERYRRIMDKYPACDETIPFYESAERDIEEAMQLEFQEAYRSFKPSIFQRHMNIQYYLRDLLSAVSENTIAEYSRTNLYSMFTTKLQAYLESVHGTKNGVSLVSFNYDTILDHYLNRSLGMGFNTMDDYIMEESGRIRLFKPHGSCNWGWPIRELPNIDANANMAQLIYEEKLYPSEVYYWLCGNFDQTLVPNSWGMEHRHLDHKKGRLSINRNLIEPIQSGKHYFPALLMPYRDKDEFVMPYDHFYSMTGAMDDVEDLYIIGWKGNERLFNKYQVAEMKNLKRIIIADPDIKGVRKNLKPLMDKYNPEVVEVKGGFDEFVRKRMDELM